MIFFRNPERESGLLDGVREGRKLRARFNSDPEDASGFRGREEAVAAECDVDGPGSDAQERALDFGVGEGADGFAGGVGVLAGEGGGGVEGAVGGEDFENLGVGDPVEGALFDDRRDAGAFVGARASLRSSQR